MCLVRARGSPLNGRWKSTVSVPGRRRIVHSDVKGRGARRWCGRVGSCPPVWVVGCVGVSLGLAASC